MKILRLVIHIQTDGGLYGVNLQFDGGLVVLRADNSSGKTTCMLSIIYALGLERMLGTSAFHPPAVLTKKVRDNAGTELSVLRSTVFLEIQNAKNETITIERPVVDTRDSRLVTVWKGRHTPNLDPKGEHQEFFLRDPGSAQREAGFHRFLTEFIGWTLPTVSQYNGGDTQLYLECIFPLLLVEQRHGWTGIQSNTPTIFGIKEVTKRALEFVLKLDVYEIIRQRELLRQQEADLKLQWRFDRAECLMLARTVAGEIDGIPLHPANVDPDTTHLILHRGAETTTIPLELRVLREELAGLQSEADQPVGRLQPDLIGRLNHEMETSARHELILEELFRDVQLDEDSVRSLRSRIAAIDEDLRRNRDLVKLRSFGAVAALSIANQLCPTCHQNIIDSLIPNAIDRPMSLDDNVAFLEEQKITFRHMLSAAENSLVSKQVRLGAIRQQVDESRGLIRSLRSTLVSDDRLPSAATIHRMIQVEERIRLLDNVADTFATRIEHIGTLAHEWQNLGRALKSIPESGFSRDDRAKLGRFTRLYIEQLEEYHFRSVRPDTLSISEETYKPTREGFDLGFEISASDNIRSIWAYLLTLLELARVFDTNHIGVIVFDEPRQQDAKEVSFEQLLRRAAGAQEHGQQVIFATSSNGAVAALVGVPHQLLNFDSLIIARLE